MSIYADQLQPFSLNGSGAVAGATTVTLKSMTDIDGNLVVMASFGTIGYGTLEPGSGVMEEQISFSGVTQNANGTATLTGVKSVTFGTPFTETSGLSKTHAGSTIFVISNTAGFYNQIPFKQNDETLTGQWSGITPVSAANLATKAYVDLVAGGIATTNQVIVVATAGETVAAGQLVYFNTGTGRWNLTDADTATTVELVQLGIAQGAGTNGNPISGGVLIYGTDSHQTGLVAGSIYYAGNTAGAVSSSVGTTERAVGIANSTTTLNFNPDFYYVPKATQKAALAGFGGTPSTSNKYALQAPTAQTYTPAGAGTATLDLSLSGFHFITMPAGNITIALSNPSNNQIFEVAITQDSVGSRTVTWFTTIRWVGGTPPTLTTTANKRDVFVFQRTGANTYDGFIAGQNL